ncbi:DegT/DnrJ/EryC1/StrS family aminotransferase [candidate division KSB1 bacterium]|nr:DegT/DnrJ/EryC1/StrS family aminotransferase [candidate division KSB1 bacterium]
MNPEIKSPSAVRREIPLVDLVSQYRNLREELLPALEHVLESGNFILGDEVALFEEEFARYCGVEHAIGVASGTEALHLALHALGIGPGDEVITAANTFIATAFAISYTGAMPVFVDVREDDFNIDVNLLEQALTPRTKAIIPVHLYGQPADIDAITRFANAHGLKVVEDACQAHGARSNDQPVGSFGHAGCFSFYPGKNLGAYGDGGAIVTNDTELAAKLRLLRQYGQSEKYIHAMVGYNSRLDTLQAAILRTKLKHLEGWNEKRREAAGLYHEFLAVSRAVLPREQPNARHVYHLYVIQHERRDALRAELLAKGIQCGIHYPVPLHLQAPYREARTIPQGAPVTTRLAQRILSLPIYPEISRVQVKRIAQAVKNLD